MSLSYNNHKSFSISPNFQAHFIDERSRFGGPHYAQSNPIFVTQTTTPTRTKQAREFGNCIFDLTRAFQLLTSRPLLEHMVNSWRISKLDGSRGKRRCPFIVAGIRSRGIRGLRARRDLDLS